jgi:hypothetical protein
MVLASRYFLGGGTWGERDSNFFFYTDDIHKMDAAISQFTTSSVFSGYGLGLTFSSFDDVAGTRAKKVDFFSTFVRQYAGPVKKEVAACPTQRFLCNASRYDVIHV